jgi:hypothetical protein
MANKEAVFTLRVNTGSSVQDVQSFDAAVQNLNNDIQEVQQTASQTPGIDAFEAKLQELNARVEAGGLSMREMTQVMKEYQTIAAQTGVQSPIGAQALQNAASLKDEIGDIKAATTALSSDFVGLDTAVAGIETGTAVFQGFQSVVALTGTESEALMQTMIRLQAAQGLANAATTIANKLNSDSVLGIKLRAFYEKAYGVVVGESTGALKNLKLAMAATGVGALVAGVLAAIGAFGDLKEMIYGVDETQKALDGTIEAYTKGAEDATTKTSEMQVQFDLAKKGVISKEEALKFYNDTLGDTFGQATNLNDAEQNFIDKKDDFIKAAAERAQAQAILALAAQEQAKYLEKEITASNDFEKGMLSLEKEFADETMGKYQEAAEALISRATAREKDAKLASQSATAVTMAAEKVSESEKKAEDNRKKSEDAAKKRADDAKKRAEQARKIAEENAKIERERIANLLKQEQEFRQELEQAESAYQDSLLTAQQQETNVVLDKYFTLIQKAKEYKQDTTVLEAARTAELLAITDKYNKEAIAKQAETDEKKKELLQAYQDIVADDLDQQVLDLERSQADQSKGLTEALAANIITQEEYNAAQLVLENEYTAKLKEVQTARTKLVTDEDKKRFDAQIASVEKGIEIAQGALNSLSAINDLVNQTQENRIAEAQAQADEQKSIYDKQQADELSNTSLTEEQRKAITDKYNKLRYQADLKAFQEEDKLKKQQFERDKAFKIAQIAIDTASAIVKSVAASPTTFGLPFSAFALATGVAQAAAVASTQYKSGTPPSLAGGGSAGSLTGAGASSFTAANTNTEQTNLQDVLGQGGNNQGTISKVYVLESDITNTQQKVSVQEQLSTY